MALLNPIPALWECGLALPSGLCKAAAATWKPVSFCPPGKAPEGLASPQCPEAPSIPRDAWRLSWGAHIVIHRGAASVCAQGCLLHVQPTFTGGTFQHAMYLPMCRHACSWHSGPHMCVLIAFTPGPALTWAHITLVAAVGHYLYANCPCAAHCIPMFVLPAYVGMLSSQVCARACMLHSCAGCILQVS